jgi:hypothetical protein
VTAGIAGISIAVGDMRGHGPTSITQREYMKAAETTAAAINGWALHSMRVQLLCEK